MDWEKHLEKIRSKKIKKTVKIKVKLPNVNKNPLARKRIFVQTPFSHSTLNLELHCLFRLDQSRYSNVASEIMKMCEHILKKTAPIQFKFFEL